LKTYPLILLPKENYKYIECDISDYYLIRHIDIEVDIPVLNEIGDIDNYYICKYPNNIQDLSTSLLGHYSEDHTKIKLTNKGQSEYGECEPNYLGTPLIKPDDYTLDDERLYWIIKCSFVNSLVVPIVHNEISIDTVSFIKHTPMKWNFWHHSIRWKIEDVAISDLTEYSNRQKQTLHQKIGAFARAIIAQNADLVINIYPTIDDNCFIISKISTAN
jgi:hypothetical protein